MKTTKNKMIVSAIAFRMILLSLIWWILSDGETGSWWVGVPGVLLAVITSTAIFPPSHLVWYEFLRFVPFFFIRSLQGGMDVAWRAFHPKRPIAPELITYRLRLPPGFSQVFLANTISLLPGTLSAALGETVLKVHVLSGCTDVLSELEALEQRVARVFGISLTDPLDRSMN